MAWRSLRFIVWQKRVKLLKQVKQNRLFIQFIYSFMYSDIHIIIYLFAYLFIYLFIYLLQEHTFPRGFSPDIPATGCFRFWREAVLQFGKSYLSSCQFVCKSVLLCVLICCNYISNCHYCCSCTGMHVSDHDHSHTFIFEFKLDLLFAEQWIVFTWRHQNLTSTLYI